MTKHEVFCQKINTINPILTAKVAGHSILCEVVPQPRVDELFCLWSSLNITVKKDSIGAIYKTLCDRLYWYAKNEWNLKGYVDKNARSTMQTLLRVEELIDMLRIEIEAFERHFGRDAFEKMTQDDYTAVLNEQILPRVNDNLSIRYSIASGPYIKLPDDCTLSEKTIKEMDKHPIHSVNGSWIGVKQGSSFTRIVNAGTTAAESWENLKALCYSFSAEKASRKLLKHPHAWELIPEYDRIIGEYRDILFELLANKDKYLN